MLLEFTVENYRSFYRKKTLVLEADKALKECTETNLFDCNKYTLLRSLALYGANSSGKSNLVSAMHAMASCVLLSVKLNDNEQLEYDPFLLLKDNHHPSMFEIIFLKGEYCYRYGFRYNLERIVEEWLFRKTTPRSKEQMMFVRNEDGICVDENNFPEGVGYEEKTNDNRLFLSLCQQLGGEISRQVISWFQSDFNVISGLNNQQYRAYSKLFFHKKESLSVDALNFFQKLRLGFNNILTHEEEPNIPQDDRAKPRIMRSDAEGFRRQPCIEGLPVRPFAGAKRAIAFVAAAAVHGREDNQRGRGVQGIDVLLKAHRAFVRYTVNFLALGQQGVAGGLGVLPAGRIRGDGDDSADGVGRYGRWLELANGTAGGKSVAHEGCPPYQHINGFCGFRDVIHRVL